NTSTSQLSSNTTYTATVQVDSTSGSASFTVFLQVGGSGSTAGLSLSPSSLTFSQSSVGQFTNSQSSTLFFNGNTSNITQVTFSPISGPIGAITFVTWTTNGPTATFSLSGNANTIGTYTGTATIYSASGGTIGLPITLNVGTGSSTGVVASQNPVSLSAVSTGSGVNPVFLTFSLNGAQVTPTSIQSVTTTTGQSWLHAFVSGNQVQVTAPPPVVSNGTYTGTVIVKPPAGQSTFNVNLPVGSSGTFGLTASPNPVNFFTSFSGGGISPQNVIIYYNGAAISPTSIQSTTTTTGQSWLQAQIQGSTVQVSANSSIVGIGSYIGTVTVNTVYGPASFTVNLNVGTSGGGSSGLVSNPSSANFTIPYGGGASNQNFDITYNGLAMTTSR